MTAATFLDQLKAAADEASIAEQSFRREAAARIVALEHARSFAFRKANLMRAVCQAIAGADDPETAVASGSAELCSRLGWATGDGEARTAVLHRFAPVILAVLAERNAEAASVDVLGAIAAFEAWYVETHETPFWALFEQYVQETPRVDF
jgi:hypothetical protein